MTSITNSPKETFTNDKHWKSFLIHCHKQIEQVGLEWVLAISLMTREGLTWLELMCAVEATGVVLTVEESANVWLCSCEVIWCIVSMVR